MKTIAKLLLSTLLVAGFVSIAPTSARAADGPDYTYLCGRANVLAVQEASINPCFMVVARWYKPCEFEDGPAPCFWNAKRRGNGEGTSFVLKKSGQQFIPQQYARKLTRHAFAKGWFISAV